WPSRPYPGAGVDSCASSDSGVNAGDHCRVRGSGRAAASSLMPLISEALMMNPRMKNGSPATVIVSFGATSQVSHAPTRSTPATMPISTTHRTRCTGVDRRSSPLAIMSNTIDEESTDVVKKTTTMSTENNDITGAHGKFERNSNSAPGTSPWSTTTSTRPPDSSSTRNEAIPNTPNQISEKPTGSARTPVTNSRMVRPREMRAMKIPTNGAHVMVQAQ